jgi:hypothetical protein
VPRPRPPEGRGAGVGRRTRGVDVVDEAHGARNGTDGHDAAADVAPPLREPETPLAREGVEPAEEIGDGTVPEPAEGASEPLRRHASPFPGTLGVARHVDENVDRGCRNDLGDERGRFGRDASPPVLLPRANEGACPLVVHDRRPRAGEREPAAGALGTAADRPGPGRSAALAHRRVEPDEGVTAGVAERGAGTPADGTALREEQLEHVAIVGN